MASNRTSETTIGITFEGRTQLRMLAGDLIGATGERVTLDDALRVACIVARGHPDEARAALMTVNADKEARTRNQEEGQRS